jgi:hypothetical protein
LAGFHDTLHGDMRMNIEALIIVTVVGIAANSFAKTVIESDGM